MLLIFRYEERALTLNKEKATLVKDNQALVKDMNTLQEECTRLKTTMVRHRLGHFQCRVCWCFYVVLGLSVDDDDFVSMFLFCVDVSILC